MKKLILHLGSFLVLFIVTSCEKDTLDPIASVVTNTSLVEPSNNSNLSLNPNLFNSNAVTIKYSSADFGYSASVKYVLEIINATDTFDATGVTAQVIPLGTYNENTNSIHEYPITTTVLNLKLKNLGSVYGAVSNFKMRVLGQPTTQLATSINGVKSYSQTIAFSSNVYNPIDESPKIYVTGNFGAASTYADWNVDLLGTSNSPLIYSSRKDGVYEGFVYMNNPSPQFKFANPNATTLNIYGVGSTLFSATSISGVVNTGATPTPLGSAPGTIAPSNVLATGNVFTTGTQGAGTYFIKVDLNDSQNKYFAVKRTIAINGATVGNIAKPLVFDSNPASPYYRMFVGNNISLVAGLGYIELKSFSSASEDRQERMGIDASSINLIPTTAATPTVENKMKISGGGFNINTPGVYKIVLDLRNSANYNIRIIN